MKNYKTN